MGRLAVFCAIFVCICCTASLGRPDRVRSHRMGSVTGLPLPRFAALRADKVNLRVGPGLRYPIKWVYLRANLPVKIEREFGTWRLVENYDGVTGWVHQALLVRRRCFIVIGGRHVLRSAPDPHARPVALLDPGVIGRITRCTRTSAWCKLRVDGYRGWLPRRTFWGTLPNEAVSD